MTNRSLGLIIILALFLLFLSEIQAQVAPVRVNVVKKRNFVRHSSEVTYVYKDTGLKAGEANSVNYSRGPVYCQVGLASNSGKPLNTFLVRWTLLLKRPGQTPQMVEGEKTVSLPAGKNLSLDTTSLDISNVDIKEVNYMVDVIVDGKTVASALEPKDIRSAVEKARSEIAADERRNRTQGGSNPKSTN